MYEKVVAFVKYNNAFTFIVASVFFGGGVTFAANPEVREAIYSSQETVIVADNGAILAVDLEHFDFNLKIDAVTEDENKYYAAYSYRTFAVEDGVWREREIKKILTANKEALDGSDFGLYVARELTENINYELSYLKRVKKSEEGKGESQKVVTVEYSGLIGKFLDPKEMTIEGYDPVIPEPVTPAPVTESAVADLVPVVAPVTEPATPPPVVSTPVVTEPVPVIIPEPVTPAPVAEPAVADPAPLPSVVVEPPISEPATPVLPEPVTPPASSEASVIEALSIPTIPPEPVTPPAAADPAPAAATAQ